MFFDLNVPVSQPQSSQPQNQSKKGKGKQVEQRSSVSYSRAQITAIEHRIDLLVHLGYSVIAFNQTIEKKIEPKTHVNILDPLISQLQKRADIIYLKRLTIILDEDSEKGFGLTNNHQPLLTPYDLLSLTPTTAATLSLACLTHSLPSPLTTHIISIPLSVPRLPFHLKHTIVRTAIKNGAVFEINYAGALGGEEGGGGEGGKKNWWAAAREVVRVTKGKGVLVSGGVNADPDLRAPRDVANLVTLLDLPQDVAHHASTSVPKSLIIRAQTRRTYRAILSEPKIVIPSSQPEVTVSTETDAQTTPSLTQMTSDTQQSQPAESHAGKKRPLEEEAESTPQQLESQTSAPAPNHERSAGISNSREGGKKRRKKG